MALDIGTNSVRSLIAHKTPDGLQPIIKDSVITRLGQGVDGSGALAQDAILRTFGALEAFIDRGRRLGVQNVYAMATSAVRDAKNRDEFLKAAQSIGVWIDVLSGEDEARLGFIGATGGRPGLHGMLDIGGGSTEIVVGDGYDVLFARSLQLGCVRVMERFAIGDPAGGDAWLAMKKWLADEIDAVGSSLERMGIPPGTVRFSGVGGTFTSLASMREGLLEYDAGKIKDVELSYEWLVQMEKQLCEMRLDARREIAGLQPKRADVIVTGCAIARTLAGRFGRTSVYAIDRDALEAFLEMKAEGGFL